MSVICPTILATDTHEYREQFERIQNFAPRVQIDLCDGVFTPTKTVSINQAWVTDDIHVDLHLMYQRPEYYLDEIIKVDPDLVIVHAEADGNFFNLLEPLHKRGIKVGVALLPKTPVFSIKPVINKIDHVLIFSGDLGHFGGRAHFELLDKVREIKSLNPNIEIGWDGGINDSNALKLAQNGVDILNVGGFIQKSSHPQNSYNLLVQSLHKG